MLFSLIGQIDLAMKEWAVLASFGVSVFNV